MRRVRILVGLATALCAFGALAGPALAKRHKEHEKHFYGEFTASALGKSFSETEPGITAGLGEVEEFEIAQLKIRCPRDVRTSGKVTAARSATYTTNVSFKKGKCLAVRIEGKTVEESKIKFTKPLVIKYRANGSATFEDEAGEAEIVTPAALTFKVKGAACTVTIPGEQTFPLKAIKKTEPSEAYSAAEYASEHEEVEGSKKKKAMFPENPSTGLLAGEQEYLEIEDSFSKIKSYEQVTEHCREVGTPRKTEQEIKEEEESTGHPDVIYYAKGKFVAYFEEKLNDGDLGFSTEPAEPEA
jgi:hypothetical protein